MRYITPHVLEDLKKKMVFVGGPRQVGKTTLAKAVISNDYPDGRYFNWDYDEDRQDILQKKWSLDNNLLVFDELHKFPRWKTWIKGIYDVSHKIHSFLVTGSARLDIYRRGGDSLMGRYHYWRLHPFTLDEIPNGISPQHPVARYVSRCVAPSCGWKSCPI
ncbi:MAG: AAA family ATPase [Deltaproteobacteria bacterium]|nr:AAA family ATPase [Deltaproteobacteria bacterium]